MFPGAAPLSLPGSAGDDQPWYVLRVYLRGAEDVARLTSGQWDVLESRGPDYLRVLGDAAVAQALRDEGYAVEVDEVIGAPALRAPLTYYGGYRTVTEHEQHLAAVAAAHPDLAVVVDYGDSWRRATGRPDGHDLWAVCITKVRPGDCALSPETDKPRFCWSPACTRAS